MLSCHVILIYHIALIHHIILIYFVLISYTLITIIHHPGIWYPIMLISCHVAILCGIISYDTDISIADTISYIYRIHGNNLRYQNWYYLGIKRLPLSWKFLNLLLSLDCNYTSMPLHSSKYLSSQECYFRLLTVVWLLSVLTLQCFDHSVFLPVTHYRPSTPLFGKMGHEMFNSNFFMIYMLGLKMRIKKDLWNMYSHVCKSHNIVA